MSDANLLNCAFVLFCSMAGFTARRFFTRLDEMEQRIHSYGEKIAVLIDEGERFSEAVEDIRLGRCPLGQRVARLEERLDKRGR